ncbi:MAG: DUF6452 family protein [Thermonemataceae bacterium]|nr:DUF6452 family protein [Thermonemataceae bacterium]
MPKYLTKAFFLVASLLSMWACVEFEQICAGSVEAPLKVNFKRKIIFKDRNNLDSIVFKDSFLYIKNIKVLENDSVLYNYKLLSDSLVSTNLIYNPLKDSTAYIFSYNKGDTLAIDTIYFGYNRQIELTSPECGVKTNYSNLKIIKHSFDSLVINNANNTSDTENAYMDIYFNQK